MATPAVDPEPSRGLGFLAEIKGLPEAVAAIAAQQGAGADALERVLAAVKEKRDDPAAWSELADSLDRAGERAAAITVANRGMHAARRQQDGEAVTHLTRQLAKLELSAAEAAHAASTAPPANDVRKPGAASEPTAVAETAAPDKLEEDLEKALRNSAATEALKILQQMAQGSIARGDFAAAQKAYNQALNLAHLSRLGEVRADQYANLGRLHWKKGDKVEAESYWRAARDQYEQFELSAKAAEMTALLKQASPTAAHSPSRPQQTGKRTTSIIELR